MKKFAEYVSEVDMPALIGHATQFHSIYAQEFYINCVYSLKENNGKYVVYNLNQYRLKIEKIVGCNGFATNFLKDIYESIKDSGMTKGLANEIFEVIVDFEESYVKHYIA